MYNDSLQALPRRKHNFDRRNFNQKKKCRCKRDIINPDLEGRKVQESNNKRKLSQKGHEHTKTHQNTTKHIISESTFKQNRTCCS